MEYKHKIGIIVTWFGKLPPYFDAWLLSAEYNKSVDFLVFTDCNVVSDSPNIIVYKTTLQETLKNFEEKLGRKIRIENSYKFCDCRAFFGITYADYLQDYDFWGYCDIDLVFGNLRKFLTDELLDKYDRFYQYGHLSIFRNTEKINHLYDLPGGIYSYKEIFEGKAKTTPEEHFGINRICDLNHIRWYANADFADFAIKYPNRLEVKHGLKNYDTQVFIWDNGEAYRQYKDETGSWKRQSFVYMHWQKRKPVIEGNVADGKMIITANKIVVIPEDLEINEAICKQYNPQISKQDRDNCKKAYTKKKLHEFLKADAATKKMWIRQKRYSLTTKRSYL